MRYDVVIVGARCAGSALALRLAGAGARVAVVDGAPLGSDQPVSTHLIQPPGMDELDAFGLGPARIGTALATTNAPRRPAAAETSGSAHGRLAYRLGSLGDRVRALAPALTHVRLSYDEQVAVLPYGPGRAAYCLRRSKLDPILQSAAADAGACLMGETRVVGLVRRDDGRVVGVEVRRRADGARTEVIEADLVVGADGRWSTVAKLVGAAETVGWDAARACFWAYWRRPPDWDPHVIVNAWSGEDSRQVFPTDGDLVLVGTAPTMAQAAAWKGDHTGAYLADVGRLAPELVTAGTRVSEVRGAVRGRYYLRQAAGPGWALIGDAGHHKDFTVGLGITDALRDARSLAAEVLAGDEAGPRRYWRGRDAARVEVFYWSRDQGAADRVNALERLALARSGADAATYARFGAVIDGRLSPYALVPPGQAVRWVAAEAARGRVSAVGPLVANGARVVRAAAARRRFERLARRVSAGSSAPSAPSAPPVAGRRARSGGAAPRPAAR